MSRNTVRLLWAIPGAIVGIGLVLILDSTRTVPMIVIGAAAGAVAGYVITGIVQEHQRFNDPD